MQVFSGALHLFQNIQVVQRTRFAFSRQDLQRLQPGQRAQRVHMAERAHAIHMVNRVIQKLEMPLNRRRKIS